MYEDKFSIRAQTMKKSVIRELLRYVTRPEIISLGGGMPDPALFPIDVVQDVTRSVLEKNGKRALQYGPTGGDEKLKKELIKRFKKIEDLDININEILPTTASQQGLDLVSKIFIDPGDIVIVGLPTYLGGLSAFNAYGAKLMGIPLDTDGMRVDLIEDKLKVLRRGQKRVKFIYVIPDFQNPTGMTMSLERRKKLISIAERYDVLILEDSPYRELRYEGTNPPMFFSLAPKGVVVSLFTFSKTLFPGMRVGYIIGHKEMIDKLITAKQGADLCSPTFTQAIVAEILARGFLDEHIEKLVVRYRDKRDCMLAALERHVDDFSGAYWTKPEGGLFFWLNLPKYMDADKLFPKAIEKKNIAYIVGSAFHCDGSGKNTMRLNFSYPTLELIGEGIKRLGSLVKEEVK